MLSFPRSWPGFAILPQTMPAGKAILPAAVGLWLEKDLCLHAGLVTSNSSK